jgi:hypothetical protein
MDAREEKSRDIDGTPILKRNNIPAFNKQPSLIS